MDIPASFQPRITHDAARFAIRGEEATTVGCMGALFGLPALAGLVVAAFQGWQDASGLACTGMVFLPMVVVVLVQYLTTVYLVLQPHRVQIEKRVGPLLWQRRAVDLHEVTAVNLTSADMVIQLLELETAQGRPLRFICDGHSKHDVDALHAFVRDVVEQARATGGAGLERERPPPAALMALLRQRS